MAADVHSIERILEVWESACQFYSFFAQAGVPLVDRSHEPAPRFTGALKHWAEFRPYLEASSNQSEGEFDEERFDFATCFSESRFRDAYALSYQWIPGTMWNWVRNGRLVFQLTEELTSALLRIDPGTLTWEQLPAEMPGFCAIQFDFPLPFEAPNATLRCETLFLAHGIDRNAYGAIAGISAWPIDQPLSKMPRVDSRLHQDLVRKHKTLESALEANDTRVIQKTLNSVRSIFQSMDKVAERWLAPSPHLLQTEPKEAKIISSIGQSLKLTHGDERFSPMLDPIRRNLKRLLAVSTGLFTCTTLMAQSGQAPRASQPAKKTCPSLHAITNRAQVFRYDLPSFPKLEELARASDKPIHLSALLEGNS